MEGFLFKKARGESTFGRHNWKLRWFVLESTQLSYFEKFDNKGGKPIDVKGIYSTDGSTTKACSHPEFKHAFMIEHPDRRPLLLAAETASLKSLWVKAINESAKLEPGEIPGKENPERYMVQLGISMSRQRSLTKMTDEELESAFKFKAIQTDPQHGGSKENYDRVHEAYNMLVQLKKQRIEDKKHVLVHFSADIQKGPPGEGFGMVVNVDDRHNIFVKRVLSCIVMKNATHNAHGEIRVGDEILGIDGESTAGWTLARLVQRLNDFRVPVGSDVSIMFQRRIKLPGDKAEALGGRVGGVEGLLEPDDEDGLKKGGESMQSIETLPAEDSLPAEDQEIPGDEVDDGFDGGGDGASGPHDLAAKHEEFMEHQERMNEKMEMLESTNENNTLRAENERLKLALEETQKKLEVVEAKKKEVELTLQETIHKSEEFFVSQSRIDDAINKTTNAGQIPEGGAWEVPEKLELTDVGSAEQLIEVEHRLLKMGLRVEGDPSELKEEAFVDSSKAVDILRSTFDPGTAFDRLTEKAEPKGYGEEDEELPAGLQNYGRSQYDDSNGPVDVFEHHDEDDDEDDDEHRARMARVGRGISFHINDPDYIPGNDDNDAEAEKEAKEAFDSGVNPSGRRKSRMKHNTTTISTLWNQNVQSDKLNERKRRESQYGHGITYKNEFARKQVSPHMDMLVEGLLKAMPAANNRLITAKDRIRIHDDLESCKRPGGPNRRARERSKSPSKRGATYDRSFSPTKVHAGLTEEHLEGLGFRTQMEDANLLAKLAENAEKLKMNEHRVAKHSPSKRLKEKDKLFVKKLLKKRTRGAGEGGRTGVQ
ncbi:hypothetical protein TrCOL_g8888 [Triparma columacea]|uniref:PH domain-containing protein n=1 Tax=Triparma columacea TaxID=722753 RepID=A0A9W7GPS8_9STRA|nr:hypothetical protein TrCOL_g8888 [Triparma columacea]